MEEQLSIKTMLKAMLDKRDFGQLVIFQEPQSWTTLTDEERLLLALLFVKRGEHQLETVDPAFLESFELASSIAPQSREIYYLQATACAAQPQHINCLKFASQAFGKAVGCSSDFFAGWLGWGDALLRMGIFYQDNNYLIEADARFKVAETILKQQELPFVEAGTLFWHWGICWFIMGKFAGEPQDFYVAIDKYKQAEQWGCEEPGFWHDYGNALRDLGMLTQQKEMLAEALLFYQKALQAISNAYDYWCNFACCCSYLYEMTFEEQYFHQAQTGFEHASKMVKNDIHLWLRWGQLLRLAGKVSHSLERIEDSLEKFENANKCDPNNPLILSRWGEAELFVGINADRLELIHAAKAKVLKSLEILPENPDVWFAYGTCLNALGNYFHEDAYYVEAIEKFEKGLSLHDSHTPIWYGLAMAHYSLGNSRGDLLLLENAIKDFSRAEESGGATSPQFWNDWGVTYMRLAEITGSKSHIELAIEKFECVMKHPQVEADKGKMDLEWLYNYGCAFDFLGDLTEDEACYERAIYLLSHVVQADSDYAYARYNLALALSHLADAVSDVHLYEKAIEHFLILLNRDPEDEMASHDLGMTYLHLAELMQDHHHLEKNQQLLQQAESKLMQSAALGNAHAYYSLGCFYSLTNNFHAAMHYIERAHQHDTLPDIDEMMQDEWLEGLRQTVAFQQFVSHRSKQQDDI